MPLIKALRFTLFFFSTMLLSTACKDEYTPKEKGYFRIEFPVKKQFRYKESCPFSFSYPFYSRIIPDTVGNAEPCWLNISFPSFRATLHLTYKPLNNTDTGFFNLVEDARLMVYKHTIKAEDIIENYYSTKNNVSGIMYELTGNTATALQFYATDSLNHFLRGALYFNTATNPDSIAPVLSFLKQDVIYLLNTLSWNEPERKKEVPHW